MALLMAQSSGWLEALAPIAPDEGIAARWLRACAQHPVRTGLALLCGAIALAPRGPAPSQRWGRGLGSGSSPVESAGSGAVAGGPPAEDGRRTAGRAPEP